ncbi:MAG: carbohydrate binding domain-containing protein [bacterium]|nr:carbohydrate binding domain-containing protein [bacterium]
MRKILFFSLTFIFTACAQAKDVAVFFDGDIDAAMGMYVYVFPENSASFDVVEEDGKSVLKSVLDVNTWSGLAFGKYPLLNVSKDVPGAVLEIKIKGRKGGEKVRISVLDAEDSDGKKVEVSKILSPLKADWDVLRVRLTEFPVDGGYWDGKQMNPAKLDWSEIKEIRVVSAPNQNTEVEFFIEYVKIIKPDTVL